MLDAQGLTSLAAPWWLSRPGSEPVEVRVLSAHPDAVVVVEAPYGL